MPKNHDVAIVEQQPLGQFTERAYLNYSMYVILDRALPNLADGLKPVQRRIIYAMSELGLKAGSKFKKSARTIGDVLGKYHPHGDSACYEAMVLMAQPFAYRYPFIEGQGNWGSIDDPKSFAAMRYTEARLTPYAQVLLSELGQGTVDWKPNFDGTLDEPIILPARLPNVLLNGGSGIAVGMSTDIPPHNLGEVVDACVYLLENPVATLEDVCQFIQGPDYPTGAEIITPQQDIHTIYRDGVGALRQRAVYQREDGEVVITALPYQVSGAKVIEQIAAQMLAKKLSAVNDLRDESDHENPIRLVIVPRSNRVDIEELMAHLFATTDLERSYRVNLNMIDHEQRPRVKDLLSLLSEWLDCRMQTVRRRLQYRLDQVNHRLLVLAGLLIAYINLDDVIHIIRTEDNPKQELIQRFELSELQADAILDIKLRQLAKLEEIKIRQEQDELSQERDRIQKILGSKARLKKLIRQELLEDKERFSDPRRSAIVSRPEARALREEEMLPSEPVTIVLSEKGWVRAAKGHDVDGASLSYRSGDSFFAQAQGRSNLSAIFIDNGGRSYALAAHTLPSARGQGEPLTTRLSPTSGQGFVGVLAGSDEDRYLLASDAGYGFIVKLVDLYTKNRNGKAVLKCPKNSEVLTPIRVEDSETQYLAVITNVGRLLIFPVADLPELARGKGNKMIQIPPAKASAREEFCVGTALLYESSALVLQSGKREFTLKAKDLVHFHGERGRRGNMLPRGFRRVERCWVA